jgi:hypothetical protein
MLHILGQQHPAPGLRATASMMPSHQPNWCPADNTIASCMMAEEVSATR